MKERKFVVIVLEMHVGGQHFLKTWILQGNSEAGAKSGTP
jgi:metal-responsive CopG/Arc/MetJ family transcriptional regulator